MDKKSILIDGNSLLYRMFYGIRDMSNSKGIPTNAIYGFVNVLVKIQQEYRPNYLGVAFDLKAPTFRHKVYDDYKAGRDKMPEDLQSQFVLLKELLHKMHVSVIEVEGYEADDIIGTLAKQGEALGAKTQIITGDRDSFQLVDDAISILYTTTRSGNQFTVVDQDYIMQKYEVQPKELIDVKALMGDASDNIPGVSGIGEKTAIKLIKQYHDIATMYDHIDDLKGKQKEKLVNGKDDAFASRFLGEICIEAPLPVELADLAFSDLFTDEAVHLIKELEFRSILKKVSVSKTSEPVQGSSAQIPYTKVIKANEVYGALTLLSNTGSVIIHGVGAKDNVWLAVRIASQYYFFDGREAACAFVRGMADIPNADEIKVIGHDLKELSHLIDNLDGTIVRYTYDTYIAAYLLSPSDQRYTLGVLSTKYLDITIPDDEDFYGKGKAKKHYSDIPSDTLSEYLIAQCDVIYNLWKVLPPLVEESGMTNLMNQIELPLLKIMASMETIGFKIDIQQLETLSRTFEERINVLTTEIYEDAGHSFNINSPKQLGVVLFEELKLPVIKKTKTGYSTSVDVLEELKLFHPMIEKVLEYRTLSKLDGTYGKGLMKLVDPEQDRIYSTFNQTVTATGRLSSSDPNLQNIPVKTSIGREIRRVFIPSSPNNVLVDADYSQIELRVLAHLSGDKNLIDGFIKEQDIHTRTASEIFNIPMDQVTKQQRSRAKAINFGLIYGKQAFSLGKELGITRKEAQEYIDTYFSRYPNVQAYMENVVVQAKEDGYVTTLWGRRRYLPEIVSRNRMLVQSGERMALNTPIQGTAADIIKQAMISVYNRLEKDGYKAQLILQVHDELIIDSPIEEKDAVLALLVEEMENTVKLSVPLTVEANIGQSWYDLK